MNNVTWSMAHGSCAIDTLHLNHVPYWHMIQVSRYPYTFVVFKWQTHSQRNCPHFSQYSASQVWIQNLLLIQKLTKRSILSLGVPNQKGPMRCGQAVRHPPGLHWSPTNKEQTLCDCWMWPGQLERKKNFLGQQLQYLEEHRPLQHGACQRLCLKFATMIHIHIHIHILTASQSRSSAKDTPALLVAPGAGLYHKKEYPLTT